jgi:diacylglycerol kinase family enzyme
MVTTEVQAAEGATVAQRWLLAPLALAANVTIGGPQAVLVSNNVYGMGDIVGLGRRARLNRGNLGLLAVTVTSAVQAAGLLAGTHSRAHQARRTPGRGRRRYCQIPVEVDGEALVLETAVRRTVRPAALPVRVPCDRPGVPDPKPIMDWKRLWRIALTMRRPVRSRPW